MTRGKKWLYPLEGYQSVRLASGLELDLDRSTAAEVRAELDRRVDEQNEQLREERRRQKESVVQQVAEERVRKVLDGRPKRKTIRAQPRPGWYRVLPKLKEMAKALEVGSAERSADKDVNRQRVKTFEKLLELGPDRRVGMPSNWRMEVDALEVALPHFSAPVRSLRNALALAEATGTAPRVAPQLLLGPPGVGKTYFTHKVAELLGTTQGAVQFDQPTAGSGLRGSDKYWSNTEPGLLFNLICLGKDANPVVLLDELDKACAGSMGAMAMNPLAQLHAALEPETARRLVDISVEIEFDASLAVYVGTANTHLGIGAPILSRMEVHVIQAPARDESLRIADAICQSTLNRLGLVGRVSFDRKALAVLGQVSPRLMVRTVEKAVAAAVASERARIGEWELWQELGEGGRAFH